MKSKILLHMRLRETIRPKKNKDPFENPNPSHEEMHAPPIPPDPKLVGQTCGARDPKKKRDRANPTTLDLGGQGGKGQTAKCETCFEKQGLRKVVFFWPNCFLQPYAFSTYTLDAQAWTAGGEWK